MDPGPISHLDGVGARIDQRLGSILRGDVSGNDLNVVAEFLDPLNRLDDAPGMSVGGIDDDHIHVLVQQSFRPEHPVLANAGRGGDAKPAPFILACVGITLRLLDILNGDETNASILLIHHQEFLDPVFVQKPLGLLAVHAVANGDQRLFRRVAGHQLADRLAEIVGETHVTVGEDPQQPATVLLHHRNAGEMV